MAVYATPDEFRGQTRKNITSDDPTIEGMLLAASELIDQYCNRPDGFKALTTATAKRFTGSGMTYQWIDECVEVTAVAVKDSATDTTYTTWAAADYIVCSGDPEYPDFNSLPYNLLLVDPTGDQSHFTDGRFNSLRGFRPDFNSQGRGAPTVQITAKWGYAVSTPPTIKQACIAQAARWFKRAESGWADTLGSADFGQMLYTKVLDPDIQLLLKESRYIKPVTGRG